VQSEQLILIDIQPVEKPIEESKEENKWQNEIV